MQLSAYRNRNGTRALRFLESSIIAQDIGVNRCKSREKVLLNEANGHFYFILDQGLSTWPLLTSVWSVDLRRS